MVTFLRNAFLTFLLFASLPSGAQGGAFVFSGTIRGIKNGTVHLAYKGKNNRSVLDSCRLTNGRFRFAGVVDNAVAAQFYTKKTRLNSADDPHVTDIFLEPGAMQGDFPAGDLKKGRLRGGPAQNDLSRLQRATDSLQAAWQPVWMLYWTAIAKQDKRAEDSLRNTAIARYNQTLEGLQKHFIRRNTGSPVSGWLLTRITVPVDTASSLLAALDPAVQSSVYGKEVAAVIAFETRLSPGRTAPPFLQPDTAGKPVTLAAFRGQWVLLDFWASWCVPCREESPYLVKAFARYHNRGFTIVGISLDDPKTAAAWRAAIAKDGLAWTQLSDLKAWDNTAARDYDISNKGLPSNFLIDPQGVIRAVSLRGDALDAALSVIFR